MRTMANRLMQVGAVAVLLSVAAPARADSGPAQGVSDMVQALMEFLTGQSLGAEVSLLAQQQGDADHGSHHDPSPTPSPAPK